MRHITEEGLTLIKRFEGFRSKGYLDIGRRLTIGFGHLVKPGEHFDEINIAEATDLLKLDIESAERSVLRLINVPLADHEFDALVSFTFNCGGGALQRSTLRAKVNREEHELAAGEFMKWSRVRGKWSKPLAIRRGLEANLYDPDFLPWRYARSSDI